MLKKAQTHNFTISPREIKDLAKAWIMLSIAFAILLTGGLALDNNWLNAFFLSMLTVGTAFIFHEMGHKVLAQHYGCRAVFKSFDGMLFISIIIAFFGFILAAPGAVMLGGPVGTRRNGKISAMGPLINIVLAIIFLGFHLVFPSTLTFYGFFINALLAAFNMLPFGLFDGKKILLWNKTVYYTMLSVSIILFFASSFFGQTYFP